MRVRRRIALVIILLLTSVEPGAFASPSPKPVVKCAKAGQTQVVGNKKFTCFKSGSKLTWNKGVKVTATATPLASVSSAPSISPTEATPSTSVTTSPSAAPALVKYKNCTEVKAAGAAPLSKTKTPELYELNAGLDRDKDGVACES